MALNDDNGDATQQREEIPQRDRNEARAPFEGSGPFDGDHHIVEGTEPGASTPSPMRHEDDASAAAVDEDVAHNAPTLDAIPQSTDDADMQRAIFASMETTESSTAFEEDLRQALEASMHEHGRRQQALEEEEANVLRQLEASVRQTCPICTRDMESAESTSCGHLFHRECLARWSMWSDSCPVCKKRCLNEDIYGAD